MVSDKNKIWLMFVMFLPIFILLFENNAEAANLQMKDNIITVSDNWLDKAESEEDVAIIPLMDEPMMLEGLIDGAEYYYEVPVRQLKKDSALHLAVEYSDLLLKGSTITVKVDDQPIYSRDLATNKTKLDIKVPLKDNALEAGLHRVSIEFYGNIDENFCANDENPANWLTIQAKSHVQLNYQPLKARKDMLEDYPYPFIQHQQDQSVQSTIVIPNDASTATQLAALQISNYMNKHANEQEKVAIIHEKEMEKISTHLITVGLESEWDGIVHDLLTTLKLETKKDELQLGNRIIQSKENQKQWLFVSAEKEEVLSDNIAILSEETYVEQLAGNDIAIRHLPENPSKEVKAKQSFEELDITSLTLNGQKRMSQNYFYQIPTYVDTFSPAYLHLKLKVADTLFTDDTIHNQDMAELVVLINNVPHSIKIDDLKDTETEGLYDVEVPIDADVFRGEQFITFQFIGHGLRHHDYCVPPSEERWIYLDDSSDIQVSLLEEEASQGFQSWPSPFMSTNKTSDTTIIVPDDFDASMMDQLQILISSLADGMTLQGLDMKQVGDVDVEEVKNRHIILLGDVTAFTQLDGVKESLELDVTDNQYIDITPFGFVNETAKDLGYIQKSVWNEEKMMALFSPVQLGEEAAPISAELIDYIHMNHQHVTMVVENENGEIFTNKQVDSTKEVEDKTTKQLIDPWMIVVFISIFTVALIIFVVIFRRSRKRK